MDKRINWLLTPKDCDELIARFEQSEPAYARAARRRKIELCSQAAALRFGADSAAERDALDALAAHEEALFVQHGKRQPAGEMRRAMGRIGILPAVEEAMTGRHDRSSYALLKQIGLKDLTFEAVVRRHARSFGAKAVATAKKRLATHKRN